MPSTPRIPGLPRSTGRWPRPRRACSRHAERTEIAEGCYDLLLVLSRSADPPAGLKILDRAARLRPEPTAAYHLRRADCLGRAGDVAGRNREEELASRRPPVSALDHFLIGREQLTRREWPEAIESLETAVAIDPSLTAAQILLAVCNYNTEPKRLDEALASLNACLRSHPDLVGLYLLRALVHGEHAAETGWDPEEPPGSSRLAEADYRAVLDRQPSDDLRYVLLVNRGGMYLQAGRFAESLADLEQAIRLQPELYQAHASLAQLYQRQGRRDAPRRSSPAPSSERPIPPSGSSSIAAGPSCTPIVPTRPPQSAPPRCTTSTRRSGSSPRTALRGPRITSSAPGSSSAEPGSKRPWRLAPKRSQLAPDDPSAHQLKISTLMALKRFDDVLGSCDAYLAKEKPSVEILEIRGLARVARRNHSGAIADYTRALGLRADLDPPTRARLLNRRGWAYHFADAPRLALDDFEASLKLMKDQSDALGGRGLARIRLGDWAPAVADADAAVHLVKTQSPGEGDRDARVQAYLNAARIYAQAVEFAALEVSRQGERAVSLYRTYRAHALDLLQQALSEVPAAERAQLLADPALKPLRLDRGMGGTHKITN